MQLSATRRSSLAPEVTCPLSQRGQKNHLLDLHTEELNAVVECSLRWISHGSH